MSTSCSSNQKVFSYIKNNFIIICFYRTKKNTLKFEDIFVKLTESGKRITSALRRRNEFPDGFDSEADNLRKQILRASNTVMESNYNSELLSYQIAALEEEMKLLAKEAAMYQSTEVCLPS